MQIQYYYAMAMDLIGSRNYPIEKRIKLQQLLAALIGVMNASGRVLMMDFSRGDEIEGLFETNYDAMFALKLMKSALWRVNVRFGIGAGEWTIKMNGNVNQQDGRVFWNMREAMEMAKTQNHRVHSIGEEMNEASFETFIQHMDLLPYEENSRILSDFLKKAYPDSIDDFNQSVEKLFECRNEYFEQQNQKMGIML